jgi:hypothetical protein
VERALVDWLNNLFPGDEWPGHALIKKFADNPFKIQIIFSFSLRVIAIRHLDPLLQQTVGFVSRTFHSITLSLKNREDS